MPVPEAVIDDADIDLWSEVQDGLAEAVGVALDQAVFVGHRQARQLARRDRARRHRRRQHRRPPAPPRSPRAASSATSTPRSTSSRPTASTPPASPPSASLRGELRRARDANGQRLADLGDGTVEGIPVVYVGGGVFDRHDAWRSPATSTWRCSGCARTSRYKLLDQAVITDDTGKVIYNLAQQDMLALRVTFRAGFAVANPITRRDDSTGGAYPFAVLTSA